MSIFGTVTVFFAIFNKILHGFRNVIIWDENPVLNGTAISHFLNSSSIFLAANQTYEVSYSATLQNTSGANASMQVVLFNDTEANNIAGSLSVTPTVANGVTATVAKTVLVQTGATLTSCSATNTGTGQFTIVFRLGSSMGVYAVQYRTNCLLHTKNGSFQS